MAGPENAQTGQQNNFQVTPKLRVLDRGQTPLADGAKIDRVIGERIALTVTVEPDSATATEVLWTLSGGKFVEDYVLSDDKTVLQEVKPAALRQLAIGVHPIEAVDNAEIEVSAKVEGSFVRASFKLKVAAPTSASITTTGLVKPSIGASGFMQRLASYPCVGIVDYATRQPGIVLHGEATPPSGGAGRLGMIQLFREKVTAVGQDSSRWESATNGDELVLDYDAGIASIHEQSSGGPSRVERPLYKFTLTAPAGRATAMENTDEPEQPLTLSPIVTGGPALMLESLDVDQSFKTFLLYRSDRADSIWVTLASLGWWWKAKVVLDSTEPVGYRLVGPGRESDSGSTDTPDDKALPTWKRNGMAVRMTKKS